MVVPFIKETNRLSKYSKTCVKGTLMRGHAKESVMCRHLSCRDDILWDFVVFPEDRFYCTVKFIKRGHQNFIIFHVLPFKLYIWTETFVI